MGSTESPNSSPSLIQQIIDATPNPESPSIALAANISSIGTGRLIVTGEIVDPTFGVNVSAYRYVGSSLELIDTVSIDPNRTSKFRLVSNGQLAVNDQLIVHQHHGNGLLGSVSGVATTAPALDSDMDGVSDAIESWIAGGDGNADGIPDS